MPRNLPHSGKQYIIREAYDSSYYLISWPSFEHELAHTMQNGSNYILDVFS